MKSCLSWERAIRVFGFNARAEASASGWPDALTPQNVVRLQYPWEGSEAERKRAIRNQNALSATMKESFSDGSLPTVERIRKEATLKEVTEAVPRNPVSLGMGWGTLGDSTWANRDFSIRRKKIQVGEHDAPYLAIEAHAFRTWLADCGEEPSEHIRAWFEAIVSESEDLGTVSPQLTEMKRSAILNQLGQHYPSLEADFNRGESWTKECRAGGRGMYYLEKVEEGCRKKWGERPRLPTVQAYRMRG